MHGSTPSASDAAMLDPDMPVPEMPEEEPPEVDRAPARAPLGSAPIPSSKPEVKVAPPKPPVDFDLGADSSGNTADAGAAPGEDEFARTVIIPPDAGTAKKAEGEAGSGNNSGQAAKPPADDDDFSSTLVIPPDASASLRKEAQASNGGNGNSGQSGGNDFTNTEVIEPQGNAGERNQTQKSGDEFIARVKQQLSSSDKISDDEKDFTSTIPQ
jgi:hypothetical protein